MKDPLVSIVIATLNSEKVLEDCLKSISIQDYPKNKIEIILADGGSTDRSVDLGEKYGARIIDNPLITAEAAKAVGVKAAKGDYIALIDSDNILPTKSWLNQMITPLLKHPEAVGSEPWKFTLRKEDGFIARYCALIGMNDPFVHFLGNYDRVNLLTGVWTEVPHKEKDMGDYLLVTLNDMFLPTIGANGTVFDAKFIKNKLKGDYLFDIDILASHMKEQGSVVFIKVKNGIIHTFCESNISKFATKQRRRIDDYLFHQSEGNRSFEWEVNKTASTLALVKFILYCVTVFPLFFQAIKGFSKKRDIAWFFHPLACEITLWSYGWGRIQGFFKKAETSRQGWKQ